MSYKLIAIDLDDTLLNSATVIPERASRAVRAAAARGALVVLCTGRTKKGMQRYYDELGLDTLMITAGGAEVYDASGRVLFSRGVDPSLVKQVLEYGDRLGVHSQVYIGGELVYREKNRYSDYYESSYGHPGIVMPDLLEQPEIITPKVLFVIDEDRIAAIKQEAEALFPMLTIKQSKPVYLEFAHPSVDKGEALAFTADYYGVRREDVIAIGDTDIDIPMLKYAGLSVAVANATPAVLDAADIVCPSHDEGGVADVIEKYVLEAAHESQAQDG
jgi:Cof subfamily protein (haloacid dehalogenase superfamily)